MFVFFYKNKFFTVFCIIFLVVFLCSGIDLLQRIQKGEFVLPSRHSGADVSSAVAVGLKNVASGDIISHGYFDRIFDDHAHIDMGDIYILIYFF